MITRHHFPALDLVVHIATGVMTKDEFMAAGRALYALDPIPRLSFWDMSDVEGPVFTATELRSIQVALAEAARDRTDGRTAIVVGSDLMFGVARQYEAMAESLDLTLTHRVFRDATDAWAWLGVDPAVLDDLPG